jgi:hypothetical protein
MAIRLDKAFGGGAGTWLRLQMVYDLAQARQHELPSAPSRCDGASWREPAPLALDRKAAPCLDPERRVSWPRLPALPRSCDFPTGRRLDRARHTNHLVATDRDRSAITSSGHLTIRSAPETTGKRNPWPRIPQAAKHTRANQPADARKTGIALIFCSRPLHDQPVVINMRADPKPRDRILV